MNNMEIYKMEKYIYAVFINGIRFDFDEEWRATDFVKLAVDHTNKAGAVCMKWIPKEVANE